MPDLTPRGTLRDATQDPALRGAPGVYLIGCNECEHVLYAGQATDLAGRLGTHAWIPPYGAVDILYGDVLKPEARGRVCAHLRAMTTLPRPEVTRRLRATAEIIRDPAERDRREQALFSDHPEAYGGGKRIWGSTTVVDYLRYFEEKGGGYSVGTGKLRGPEGP